MRLRSRLAVLLVSLWACHRHAQTSADGDDADGAAAEVATVTGPSAASDAGPPSKDAPRVWAITQVAPIFSGMEFPPKDPDKAEPERRNVVRLGYFRSGESVPIKSGPTKTSSCSEGWFELLEGGFVCGRFVTQDSSNATMLRPPLDEGPLPYKYAMNLVNGAPLYREIPTIAQRTANEKNMLVGRTRSGDLERAQQSAAEEDGGVPWYLQDHKGARPMVSFEDMRGDHGPDLLMRMVKGFYVGVDGEVKTPHHHRDGQTGGGKLWRTTSNAFVPEEYVLVHQPVTEFEGVDFRDAQEARKLPLGWVTNPRGAWKFTVDTDAQKVHRKDHMDRFTIVELTGKEVEIHFKHYYEMKDGFWLRDVDGAITKPGGAPDGLLPDEKWIDVNLGMQSLVAFEGTKPIYATIISSGRRDDKDPTKDHPTQTGNFRVREKHIAATMDDDSASDGPYSIQDVPWIMYFHGGIALHGAFWHSAFGHQHSHGCVNLTPYDAKKLFMWTGPRLPEGWHGIHATDSNPGTRVIVHD